MRTSYSVQWSRKRTPHACTWFVLPTTSEDVLHAEDIGTWSRAMDWGKFSKWSLLVTDVLRGRAMNAWFPLQGTDCPRLVSTDTASVTAAAAWRTQEHPLPFIMSAQTNIAGYNCFKPSGSRHENHFQLTRAASRKYNECISPQISACAFFLIGCF